MIFKCLSLKQPWAWLVMQGVKTVETRTWTTSYRGPLLCASSKSFDGDGYEHLLRSGITMPRRMTDYEFGKIISLHRLREVVPYTREMVQHGLCPFTEGERRFGFDLVDRHVFSSPIPVRGKLNLFDVELPDDLVPQGYRP